MCKYCGNLRRINFVFDEETEWVINRRTLLNQLECEMVALCNLNGLTWLLNTLRKFRNVNCNFMQFLWAVSMRSFNLWHYHRGHELEFLGFSFNWFVRKSGNTWNGPKSVFVERIAYELVLTSLQRGTWDNEMERLSYGVLMEKLKVVLLLIFF